MLAANVPKAAMLIGMPRAATVENQVRLRPHNLLNSYWVLTSPTSCTSKKIDLSEKFFIPYLARIDTLALNKSVETSSIYPTGLLDAARSKRRWIASAYSRWIAIQDWHVALTLNFDRNVSREAAVQAARIYWHRLDVELFGTNAVARRNTRITRACFIEGERGARNWHYHAAVQLPVADHCRCDTTIVSSPKNFGDVLVERWGHVQGNRCLLPTGISA
jgi:hypothetical protein